jgi:hypothetical protein
MCYPVTPYSQDIDYEAESSGLEPQACNPICLANSADRPIGLLSIQFGELNHQWARRDSNPQCQRQPIYSRLALAICILTQLAVLTGLEPANPGLKNL